MDTSLRTEVANPQASVSSRVVRHTHSDDLEEHTQQLLDWQLEYDQLDGGRFEGRFFDVRLPGLQLFMEGTSRQLRQRGVLSAGSVGMAMMLGGQGNLTINGVRPGHEGLAGVHNAELEMTSPAGCTLAGVLVDEALLQQVSHDLLGQPLELRKGMVTGLATEETRVAPLVSALRSGLLLATARAESLASAETQMEVRDNILVHLVHVLANARDADTQGRASQRKWLVDRACELMMSRADEPPLLDDVCSALGFLALWALFLRLQAPFLRITLAEPAPRAPGVGAFAPGLNACQSRVPRPLDRGHHCQKRVTRSGASA